jgi:transposase
VIGVEQWAEIRRLYFAQGWKKRAIARHLGLQRRTVDRALASETLPSYQRASRSSCLDEHKPQVRSLLQRFPKLSAVRILEELQGAGYQGQLTILRDYLRQVRPEFVAPPAFQRTVWKDGKTPSAFKRPVRRRGAGRPAPVAKPLGHRLGRCRGVDSAARGCDAVGRDCSNR